MEEPNEEANHTIKISRKVLSAKQWLTIEDWMECGLPLCPLEIKHEGRIERSQENIVQTIFASTRLGGSVLSGGNSQVNCLSKWIIINVSAPHRFMVKCLRKNISNQISN